MATTKPKGLGRGLQALLGPHSPPVGAELLSAAASTAIAAVPELPRQLPLSALVPGAYQPRTRMDEGALYELAESIKVQGIMQPILVRPVPVVTVNTDAADAADLSVPIASLRYEIIAGERRFRAAQLAGLSEVPVLVRDVPNEAAAAMALIENIQREDLNPLEQAQGLQRLIREFGLTHEEVAQAVGRSRSATSNLLRLLNLADPVQTMLMAGDIDMGHARALLALDRASQISAATQINAQKLSVRQTEALTKKWMAAVHEAPASSKNASSKKSGDLRRVEEELSDQLMAPVQIRFKKHTDTETSGELVIGFASLDALNGLIEHLRGPHPVG